MILTLDGETIKDVKPTFGYLHRGIEKWAEERTYLQCIPITDRLDYITSMSNNWAYCRAVERLADIPVPERAEHIRVIMGEFTRIISHLLAIGALLNDMGAFFTPFVYALRDRERILDLFEMACGSRMTCNYMRFGGVAEDLTEEMLQYARELAASLPPVIDELERLLTTNEILLVRTKGVGVLPRDRAISYGATGPVLRASGVQYDVRRVEPYSVYDRFDFDVPVLHEGDTYARYLIRIAEMRESLRILDQALAQIPEGEHRAKTKRTLRPPAGEAYARIEAPKGELGFYLVSDGGTKPYRWHVRAPTFVNLGPLAEMVRGWKVPDLIVVFGSIDITMGEVDR
jgi:NADH-quinone oxidoreductase subunit D